MRIGIDFDNTIVSYDQVFYRVAVEQGLVPDTVMKTKLKVRDWLREAGRENEWTELQGYVYGTRMDDAETYPGVKRFLAWARGEGIATSIISHKTKHPFMGPKYDLHEAARGFVRIALVDDEGPLVPEDNVFFETTKDAKWARIASTNATHFIDDLPEILLNEAFPAEAVRMLFDPDNHHSCSEADVYVVHSWREVHQYFSK